MVALLEQNYSTTNLRGGPLLALANELFTDLCPATLISGTNLGPYRIDAFLGAGGMGEVYRARDSRLNRTVAIKVIRGRGSIDLRSRERFQREARTASALNHPNICAVYDIGECEGRPYLVMEYLEGCTLQVLLRQGPLEIKELLAVSIQIADSLHAAHSCGILHRDIKAANVFVTNGREAKVLDFGIAKALEYEELSTSVSTALTETGAAVGTMAYMSPEQARGEKLDARSDLFSFGVLIYQMATGQLPFAGSTTALVFDAILNREPAPLRRLRAELPQELEKIASAALEKNREARVRSAADLKLALNDLKYRLESGLPAPAPVRGAKKFAFSVWQRRLPVLLILLALVGFASLSYLWLARRFSPAVRSLVVLPLENLPPVASQRYLADGMTDGLILELSRIASLQVIKAARKPLTELARELRSSRFVDGSVSRSGEQVRVPIKVIETPNNQILWQESYQGGLGELPGLQSAAARDIVRILKIPVTPQELAGLSRSRSINSEAYDAYLRGRQLWNRQTAKDLRSAAEEFRSSIDAAPNYAPSYAGLADCYSILAWFGVVRPLDVLDAARAAARKAQRLDPNLAEAYISVGIVSGFSDWDWAAAERAFKKALSLNPSLADCHHWYAHLLEPVGRPDEGLAELKRAHELDALYPLVEEDVANSYLIRRDYPLAFAQVTKLLALEPNFWRVHYLLGRVYRGQRRFPEAISEVERAVRLSGANALTSAGLGQLYALSGREHDARRVLTELIDRSRKSYIDAESVAEIYLALGRKDEALDWLERACSDRSLRFAWIAKREPTLDSLRADPRFKVLLKRMGLASPIYQPFIVQHD